MKLSFPEQAMFLQRRSVWDEDITCSWNVEGLDSGYLTYDENSHLSAIKLSPSGKKNVITVVDSKLEVTRTSRSTLMGSRGWNGATVVLTPVFEKGEYSATVKCERRRQGNCGSVLHRR